MQGHKGAKAQGKQHTIVMIFFASLRLCAFAL
jgi:hypothetical protein